MTDGTMIGKIKQSIRSTGPARRVPKKAANPAPPAVGRQSRLPAQTPADTPAEVSGAVQSALAWLKGHSKKATREGMARYGIPSDNALGVTMADMKLLGKRLGKNHALAAALWDTGVYEARTVASFVAEPPRLTPGEMDLWCGAFDSWAICDTVCFNLFDRVPHAFSKVAQWALRPEEFVKRAAFALLWGLTVHDKDAGDDPFMKCLPLVENAASDERNFVKKAVNMALRAVGKRNANLHAAAVAVARRLSDGPAGAARWVGTNAFRELTSPTQVRRLRAR